MGNTTVGIDTRGNIQIHTPTGKFVASIPLYHLLKGPGRPVFGNEDRFSPFGPGYGPGSDARAILNHMGLFFSTASSGFGFRINYDRKLSPQLRFIASPEFLTYGLLNATSILGDQMPNGTTRVTLISVFYRLA